MSRKKIKNPLIKRIPKEIIGDWKKYADAAFDKATNSYIAAIKKGSSLNKDYSIRVKSEKNVSETKNDEILKEDSYSNAGNMNATTYDIPYTAKLGWEISASGLDEGCLLYTSPSPRD